MIAGTCTVTMCGIKGAIQCYTEAIDGLKSKVQLRGRFNKIQCY